MNKCILIFDDDKEISFVCKVILEKENYHVATRSNCDNLLNDVAVEQPGLIFMDLWIPEMGGENATYLIKHTEETKHIPVILFSANDEIDKIFSSSGADGYLRKPFGMEEMLYISKKFLGEVQL